MTLSDSREFMRGRMDYLGYTEWTDGFNTDNIPNTVLDKSYHISSPSGTGIKLNMHDQIIDFENDISVFRRGFRNPGEAIDIMVGEIQTILCDFLAPAQRLTNALNIKLRGFTMEPLSDDNDNIVKATLNLTIQVSLPVTQ